MPLRGTGTPHSPWGTGTPHSPWGTGTPHSPWGTGTPHSPWGSGTPKGSPGSGTPKGSQSSGTPRPGATRRHVGRARAPVQPSRTRHENLTRLSGGVPIPPLGEAERVRTERWRRARAKGEGRWAEGGRRKEEVQAGGAAARVALREGETNCWRTASRASVHRPMNQHTLSGPPRPVREATPESAPEMKKGDPARG
jgi:hypothetical protein